MDVPESLVLPSLSPVVEYEVIPFLQNYHVYILRNPDEHVLTGCRNHSLATLKVGDLSRWVVACVFSFSSVERRQGTSPLTLSPCCKPAP